MTSLRFLDTNILLYSISRDPAETTKHDRAVALIDEGNNALRGRRRYDHQSVPMNFEQQAQTSAFVLHTF
jgi:hypothetical protein